jgi:hypothetical protein
VRRWSCQVLTALALLVSLCPAAVAAELSGVQFPDSVRVDGRMLVLNGFGERLYSFLRIPIYVAALYLQHPSTDPEAIIRSPETKLLTVRFQHDVSAERAREAWREGFDNNCPAPCRLDPGDVARFLAAVPAMHAGEVFSILFTRQGATIASDGRLIGRIPTPRFAQAMLATFLGPRPGSMPLKQDLLKGPCKAAGWTGCPAQEIASSEHPHS